MGAVLKTTIGRLRAVGMLEAASFLVLLFVGMPLKYMAESPLVVRVAGPVHGVLFLLFVVVLFQAKSERSWSLLRTGGFFVAALLPFGPFVVDGKLRREDESVEPTVPDAPERA
jgi:integral membrane protein